MNELMQDQARIITNPDGSINTAYYMARGRVMRSAQAHRLAKTSVRKLWRLATTAISRTLAAAHVAFHPLANVRAAVQKPTR